MAQIRKRQTLVRSSSFFENSKPDSDFQKQATFSRFAFASLSLRFRIAAMNTNTNTNASATGAGASAPSPAAGGGGANVWFSMNNTAAPTSNSSLPLPTVGSPNTHNTHSAVLPVQSPTAGNIFLPGGTPAGGTGAAQTAAVAPRVGGTTIATQPTAAGISFQTAAAAPQVGGGTITAQPTTAGNFFHQTAAVAPRVGGTTIATQPTAAGISFQSAAAAPQVGGGTIAAQPTTAGNFFHQTAAAAPRVGDGGTTIATQPPAPAAGISFQQNAAAAPSVGGGTIAVQPPTVGSSVAIKFALGTSTPVSGKARSRNDLARSARSRNDTAPRMTPSGGDDAMDLGDENSNAYNPPPFAPPYFQSLVIESSFRKQYELTPSTRGLWKQHELTQCPTDGLCSRVSSCSLGSSHMRSSYGCILRQGPCP